MQSFRSSLACFTLSFIFSQTKMYWTNLHQTPCSSPDDAPFSSVLIFVRVQGAHCITLVRLWKTSTINPPKACVGMMSQKDLASVRASPGMHGAARLQSQTSLTVLSDLNYWIEINIYSRKQKPPNPICTQMNPTFLKAEPTAKLKHCMAPDWRQVKLIFRTKHEVQTTLHITILNLWSLLKDTSLFEGCTGRVPDSICSICLVAEEG